MKKNRYLLLALTVIICFGVVFSAGAAQLTAKQMVIDKLRSSDFFPMGDINKTSSGTAYYQVKTLDGVLASSIDAIAKMSGADLKLDYKLDTPDNKMAFNYIVNYDGGKYTGGMFIDNGRFIMTTEILSLLSGMSGGALPEGQKLPQYVYMNNPAYTNMWGNINKGQYIQPELIELMVFFVEAIPDKYFSVSLADQKVSFVLDQNGFEDVVLAELNKVAAERERFASLVADYFAASGQQQAADMIKSDIIKAIEQGISDGSYPNTPDKVKKMFAGIVTLKELKYEASLISPGQNSLDMTLNFGGGTELSGQVVFESDFTSSKELLSGTYSLDFKASSGADSVSVDGTLQGEFKQTGKDSKLEETLKLSVQDYSSGTSMLNLLIEGYADAAADPNVQVNIPVLTPANSKDLEKLFNNTPTVILNGAPVAFDVDPYVVPVENGSRILVPLRTLAEALGCEVGWVAPDQINITRGDTAITMYINKTGYTVNGEERVLDAPPFIMGSSTMVPLRFVAQELGCTVEYDSGTNTVNIYSN